MACHGESLHANSWHLWSQFASRNNSVTVERYISICGRKLVGRCRRFSYFISYQNPQGPAAGWSVACDSKLYAHKSFLCPKELTISNTLFTAPYTEIKMLLATCRLDLISAFPFVSFSIFYLQKTYVFVLPSGKDQFSGPVLSSRGHFIAHGPALVDGFFVCMQVRLKRISQIIYANSI